MASIPTPALIAGAVGGLVLFAAVKGINVGGGLRSILGGKIPQTPAPAAVAAAATAAINAAGGGGTLVPGDEAPSNSLASAGQSYVGRGGKYRFGHAKPAGWDCSGFTNYVANHDAGLPIPGYAAGKFTGSVHGPVTLQWLVWSGLTTIPRASLQAGDIVVWASGHMGIATSNSTYVNAPGPNGTPAPVDQAIPSRIRGVGVTCRRYR